MFCNDFFDQSQEFLSRAETVTKIYLKSSIDWKFVLQKNLNVAKHGYKLCCFYLLKLMAKINRQQ